jgi:hypothetical protein
VRSAERTLTRRWLIFVWKLVMPGRVPVPSANDQQVVALYSLWQNWTILAAMMVPPLGVTVAKALFTPLAKRLPDLLLGSKAERELAKCVEQAIQNAVAELAVSATRLESLSLVLEETFSRPLRTISSDVWKPSDGSLSVLIGDQIRAHLAVLNDEEVTGVGTSSLKLLDVDAEILGEAMT